MLVKTKSHLHNGLVKRYKNRCLLISEDKETCRWCWMDSFGCSIYSCRLLPGPISSEDGVWLAFRSDLRRLRLFLARSASLFVSLVLGFCWPLLEALPIFGDWLTFLRFRYMYRRRRFGDSLLQEIWQKFFVIILIHNIIYYKVFL